MISDDSLAKFSLALTIVGIVALYFVVQNTEPVRLEISDISHAMVGNHVALNGYINKMAWRGDNLFITLENNGSSIKVVMFSRETKKFSGLRELEKGDEISVVGRVGEYKTELEIIAEKIEKI